MREALIGKLMNPRGPILNTYILNADGTVIAHPTYFFSDSFGRCVGALHAFANNTYALQSQRCTRELRQAIKRAHATIQEMIAVCDPQNGDITLAHGLRGHYFLPSLSVLNTDVLQTLDAATHTIGPNDLSRFLPTWEEKLAAYHEWHEQQPDKF